MDFDHALILENLEKLRLPNGAFIASPTEDYSALWIRDQLYCAMTYYYLGPDYYEKLVQSVQVIFNVLHTQRHKLERIVHPRDHNGGLIVAELIHSKYHPTTLNEMTKNWGHHQLDALGLFLHVVADLYHKHIPVLRDRGDREILELLIFYLQNVSYWAEPDNGMWEECLTRKSSSIGAVVGGLEYVERRKLATFPRELLTRGRNELYRILPNESKDTCGNPDHNHDCDASQLFLIWPFNVVDHDIGETILSRIVEGHRSSNSFHRLVQPLGVNRYWGDNYRRSKNGISAQWQWEYLISIIYSQRHEYEKARTWFEKAAGRITKEGYITEAFTDEKPNDHTPLGWMHALALIAYNKLMQKN